MPSRITHWAVPRRERTWLEWLDAGLTVVLLASLTAAVVSLVPATLLQSLLAVAQLMRVAVIAGGVAAIIYLSVVVGFMLVIVSLLVSMVVNR